MAIRECELLSLVSRSPSLRTDTASTPSLLSYLDGSGRQRGQERLLNSYGPYDSAELPALSDDTSLAGPQHILQHSHLGLSPYRHEPNTNNPFYDVVLYDFLKLDDADEARGMYRSQWVEPEEDDYANHQSGGWFVYDKLCFETTLSTTVQPLKPDDACSGILMGFDQVFGEDGRGDELNLTVTSTFDVRMSAACADIRGGFLPRACNSL